MRAFVYTRQSLDRTGEGAAVDRQRDDCLKLCAERGWEVVRDYSDNDVSASSGKPRPQYQAMLAAVERGEAEVIVAWHPDRLARRILDLEGIVSLSERTGVRVATVTGDLDLTNDMGRMLARILASVAQGEVERKGARQSAAQQQAAQKGKPTGGRRPFGYGVDTGERKPAKGGRELVVWDVSKVNEPEAALIKAAYRRILEGGSLRSIATEWNAAGVTTTMGNAWTHSTVRRMLANPRNAALRSYRGEIVGPAQWPALVDVDTYEAVRALLRLPERRTTTGTARLYLLPGLALCHCGSPVTTGRTQHGVRTYRCRARKGELSRAAEPIDDLVQAVAIDRLSRPDARDLLHDTSKPDLAAYRSKADAIRERLDDLATALADGVLSLPAVRQSSDRLRRELAEVEAQMANVSRADVLGPLVGADDVGTAWEQLDLARKRAVIDTLMTVTLLKPLRGRQAFDPETVRIEWKGEA